MNDNRIEQLAIVLHDSEGCEQPFYTHDAKSQKAWMNLAKVAIEFLDPDRKPIKAPLISREFKEGIKLTQRDPRIQHLCLKANKLVESVVPKLDKLAIEMNEITNCGKEKSEGWACHTFMATMASVYVSTQETMTEDAFMSIMRDIYRTVRYELTVEDITSERKPS